MTFEKFEKMSGSVLLHVTQSFCAAVAFSLLQMVDLFLTHADLLPADQSVY